MNVVSQLISVSQQIEAEWLETNIVVAHQFLYIAVAELTEGRGGGAVTPVAAGEWAQNWLIKI